MSDIPKIIELWKDFFSLHPEVVPATGKVSNVPHSKVREFSLELAEELSENPEDCIKCAELALESQGGYNPLNSLNSQSVQCVQLVQSVQTIADIPYYFSTTKDRLFFLLHVYKEGMFSSEIKKVLSIEKSTLSMALNESDPQIERFIERFNERFNGSKVLNTKYRLTKLGHDYVEQILKDHDLRSNNTPTKPKNDSYFVRVYGLPESATVEGQDLRSTHLNKFICIKGVIRQRSDVRPHVTSAKFECPSCGNTLTVLQLDAKFREPTKCGCGRKGRFRLLDKEMVDCRGLLLKSETCLDHKGTQVILKNDLVELDLLPGQRIKINGILKEVPILAKDGGKLTRFDLIMDAVSIEHLEDVSINLSKSDITDIENFAATNGFKVLDSLSEIFAQNIEGYAVPKKALLLQLVSGEDKAYPDKNKRLSINQGIFSNPGSGKTQLAKATSSIALKSSYVDATKSTGNGLTATVVKDEFLGGYALEAGALPLTGDGLCVIDELDKVHPEQSQAISEPMESHSVTIAKANVHTKLPAPARVLALGNFVDGMDQSIMTPKLLNIKPQVLDRFDLLYRSDAVKPRALGRRILNFFQDSAKQITFLRKYIYYARKRSIDYTIDEELQDKMIAFFEVVQNGNSDFTFKFSGRLLESLRRIAYASAKLRLADKVEACDIDISIFLIKRSLQDMGYQIVPEEAI